MSTREKFVVTHKDGTKFAFNSNPNIVEKQRIQQEATELCGGWDQWASLNSLTEMAYLNFLEYGEKKYGKDEFPKMQQGVIDLRKKKETESDEYTKLFDKVYGNPAYLKYVNLATNKAIINNYAFMIVMCVEPVGYDFKDKEEKYLQEIIAEIRKQHNFFRLQDQQTEEDSSPGQDGTGDKSGVSEQDKADKD